MLVIYLVVKLPKPVDFEWDKGNVKKNFMRHGVTDKECEEPFANNPLLNEDAKHSTKLEKRFQVIGLTDKKRMLFISFTIRRHKVRIISARDVNKKERRIYEEAKTTS